MGLRRILAAFAAFWPLFVLGPVLAGATAYLVGRAVPPTYRASTTIFVNYTASPDRIRQTDNMLNEQLVKTYVRMVGQPDVYLEVIKRLHLDTDLTRLGRTITIQPIRETQLFEIAAEARTPESARDIANTIAAVFVEVQVPRLGAEQSGTGVMISQPAILPVEPISPRILTNTAMAVLFSLVVVAVAVVVLDRLVDGVRSAEDLARVTGLAALSTVSRFRAPRDEREPLVALRPDDPAAEAYHLIRTNLGFASLDRRVRTILVTSSGPAEGKSTTAANLAVALSHVGKRVLVIDADLRKPRQHRLFGVPNQRGLSNVLLTDDISMSAVQEAPIGGVWVLPAGTIPPNPAELLQSQRFVTVLNTLASEMDVVIVDSPPVLAAADAIIVASRVDGTVLVVDASRTRADMVRRAVEAVGKSGTHLLGGVINKGRPDRDVGRLGEQPGTADHEAAPGSCLVPASR